VEEFIAARNVEQYVEQRWQQSTVATACGAIVGVAVLEGTLLDLIWVEPSMRSKGIGSSLMDHVENQAALGRESALAGAVSVPSVSHGPVFRNDARALGTIFVVLRCPLDRQEPALAPLHPDLGFRLQFEGRLIQTSEPNLDERVTGTDWIKQSRPTERAEATSTIA
jgi:GNAT superfamily N-acetyltransferase